MCNRCPHIQDPDVKGFWSRLAKKPCGCNCSGPDIQIVQEQEQEYTGTDALGRQNYIPKFKSFAFCSKCRHKFRI